MRNIIVISLILGIALLYLLSSNSVNTEVLSLSYYSVLGLTGTLALFLMGLLGYQLWHLRNKLKNKVFGAKLTLRLVLFFTLISVVPGILLYAVSVQFLGKSIESWFDVKVEKALEGGLNLGRSGLDNVLKENTKKAKSLAATLSERHPSQFQHSLQQVIHGAEEAALFSSGGNVLASIVPEGTATVPNDDLLAIALKQGEHAMTDDLPPPRGMIARSLVRFKADGGEYVLQLSLPVPGQIAKDAQAVEQVYQEYQQLTFSRSNLKRLYAITLTLSLLIVLLSAVSTAVFISERIGASLEALAEGTRAVAQGDFTGQRPIQSSDELGALTGLFNQMTRQLFEAKLASEQQQREVESAKTHLESVLTHLSSGVLALDEQLRLHSSNTSADQILSASLQEMRNLSLQQMGEKYNLLASFCGCLGEAFAQSPDGEWQRQIERLSRNGVQILLIRGTRLPPGGEAGYVVVFDDISHLLQAERQAAWGEVARRLAHEIKNPLTPIQLSAERLQHKLSSKLDETDAQLLQRATQTIVSQVVAMKNMVGDFADYARAPASKLAQLDVHKLIKEVMGLYDTHFIALQLDASSSVIQGDATRVRQVIHNLLQNAQDAVHGVERPRITLLTENHHHDIYLRVEDNGAGFTETALSRAFEPYMTTKSKGTGLGLAIVKKIIEEHGGTIGIENNVLGGARINISLPLAEVV